MKKEWVQYSSKKTKNSKLAKMEAFQKFLMARCAISACILNPAYTLLAFLLLTLYHLLIQHYIFNDHIGRNV